MVGGGEKEHVMKAVEKVTANVSFTRVDNE